MKEQTLITKFNSIEKEQKQLFGIIIQLSQEIQMLGGRQESILSLVRKLPGYDQALIEMKLEEEKMAADLKEQETAPANDSTQETSTVASDFDYGDEDEKRMDIIGQNGNTGEHYE